MTNESGVSSLMAGQVMQVHWVQKERQREREREAWIFNFNLCHASQLHIYHSGVISGASSFHFLLLCFSPGHIKINPWSIPKCLLCHVYRALWLLVVADSTLVKRPMDSGGFKNDPLREQAKPRVLTDEQRMQENPIVLRDRGQIRKKKKCPEITHL